MVTTRKLGSVRAQVFAELLRVGVSREEFARDTIDVARETFASLRLVPKFHKEQGDLHIDIVLYEGPQAFDEVLVEMNDAALLAEIGYEPPSTTPLDAAA